MKNKKRKFILGILLGALTLGAIGFTTYEVLKNDDPIVEIQDESFVKANIISRGVNVRLLSTQTQTDESVVKTFSYIVTPSNATNKDVTISAKYLDGSDCSSVVTVSVDTSMQQFTITCKGSFSQQIKVTLVSVDNPNATAEVTLNYVKKIETIEGTITNLYVGKGWEYDNENDHIDTSVTYADFITPTYSDHTKDQSYTFAMKDIEVIKDEFLIQGSLSSQDTDELYKELTVMLYDAFNNQGSLPTTEDIWNAVDSDGYRSWLLSVADSDPMNDHYLCLEVRGTIYCVEDPSISVQLGGGIHFYVYFSFQDDYSAYKIGVDGVSIEQSQVDF